MGKFFSKNIVNTIFFLLAVWFLVVAGSEREGSVEIVFFDVGQGDAILIQQDNFQVLVDGGPDDSIVYHLAKKLPLGDKTIEIVVLTHPHEDHIRGLLSVLEEFTVEKILFNKVEYENRAYMYMLENYEELLIEVVNTDVFQYGDILGTVLYPPDEERVQSKNINNESVVLMIQIKEKKILLMGDAEHEVEAELLEMHNLPNVYILKAGHHCSKTSSSEMFLRTVSPEIAICSYGKGNKFGHPHHETLEKFQTLDVQYLETCKEGHIVIKFDDL